MFPDRSSATSMTGKPDFRREPYLLIWINPLWLPCVQGGAEDDGKTDGNEKNQ